MISKEERKREKKARKGFRKEVQEAKRAEKEASKKALATKKLILEGLSHRENITVEEYPELIFVLAPITDSEYTQVRATTMSAIDFDKMDLPEFESKEDRDILKAVNVGKMIHNIDEAKYLALSFSLTRGMDEEWTPEDVGALKMGVPDKLYDVLDKMCGLTAETRAKSKGFP